MSNLATIVNNILADSGIDDINVVVTNGSYANPAWITSLAWTKITGAPSNIVTGTGTTNTLPKFTGASTIGDSLFTDNGTNGAIGGTNYSGGTGVRSFNISAPLYAGLAFWANNVYSGDIFSYESTGNLIISADPTNVLATSKLILSVDGTNKVVVLGNGNVGIGDITASAKLEIQTASGAEALALSGYQLLKWDLGDQLWFGGYNAGQWSTLKFATNGSERFRVTIGGNLDFNINGSQSYIHLNQGTNLDGGLIFRRNNSNTWQLTQTSSGDNLLFYSYGVADNVLTLNYSTRAATFTGSVTASSLIRSGGTSSQYLMADGSVSTLTNPVTGSGTNNRITKFTSTGSTIGNSNISDDGSGIIVTGGAVMTSGWNRNTILEATYPVLVYNSNGSKWAGIGYDYSAGLRIWVNASSSDVTLGANNVLFIDNSGAATFSSSVTANSLVIRNSGVPAAQFFRDLDVTVVGPAGQGIEFGARSGSTFIAGAAIYGALDNPATTGNLVFQTLTSGSLTTKLTINSAGAATFSSSVTAQVNNILADGAGVVLQGYVDNNLRIAARGSGYNSGARGGLLAKTGDFDGIVNITSSSTTGYLRVGGGNGAGESRVFIEAAGDNSYIDSYGDNTYKPLQIQASNLILNSASGGNVLVGTSTDGGYKLNVAGTIRSVSSTPLIISMSTNGGNDAVVSASWTDGNSMQMRYNPNSALGYLDNTYPVTAGQVWGNILVRQNVGGTMTNRILIQATTGNVGIGTDITNHKITVNGYVRSSGLSINEIGGTISGFIGYEKNWLGSGSSNRVAIAAESDAINFYTSGSTVERVRITNNYIWTNPNNIALNMYLQLNRQSSADGGIILQTDNSNDWQIVNAQQDLWFYSYGIAATAFRVMRNTGNFLINSTTDDGTKLRVNGGTSMSGGWNRTVTLQATYPVIVFNSNGSKWGAIGYDYSAAFRVWVNASSENATTGLNAFSINNNGTAEFSSSVTATSFFESSDANLKTLVLDNYQAKGIDSVVAKLYIKNGKEELGYYAQDLEDVLPSAVSKSSDGLLNLSYREVHTAKIAYLEKEIKELKEQLKNK